MSDNLPDGWTTTLLSDVAFVNMGQSPDSSSYNDQKKVCRFFRAKPNLESYIQLCENGVLNQQKLPKQAIFCFQFVPQLALQMWQSKNVVLDEVFQQYVQNRKLSSDICCTFSEIFSLG